MIESIADDAVALIRYSNPPEGTIDPRGAEQLLAAVEDAISQDGVHAIVLTGENDVFIRHFQLESIEKTALALRSGTVRAEDIVDHPFARLTARVSASPKPVIAAINGICMGGGFELALACDLRIASEHVSHIGLPEIRAGIFPGGGGTVHLPRLIGEARAREFILRGMVVDAQAAQRLGLVHETATDAVTCGVQRARELATRPAAALAHIKQLINLSAELSLEGARRRESLAFYELLQNDDRSLAILRDTIERGIELSELD